MNKKEVQKMVLQNGKPIGLKKFTWNEKTKTFSSSEDNLVIDFSDTSYCTFITGNYCSFKTSYGFTFKTGAYCTFDTGYGCKFYTGCGCKFKTGNICFFRTGSDCNFNTYDKCIFSTNDNCIFKTGSNCTFNTGSDCTFDTDCNCIFKTGSNCTFKTTYECTFNTGYGCKFKTCWGCNFITEWDCTFETGSSCIAIIKHTHESQVIKIKEEVITQIAPYKTKGYIENGIYSETGKPAIICDGILGEYTYKKVINGLEIYKIKGGYIVKKGDVSAHGKTIKKCLEDLKFKISNRDTSKYENYTLDTIVSQEDAIKMYRIITGACEFGTKNFCSSIDLKDEYSIKEIIDITKGQYGNETFKNFFINKGVKND